jgi:PqqD family protein of HPr-rel-A system
MREAARGSDKTRPGGNDMPTMRPRIRSGLAVEELDGEALIYDEESGQLHHLNPTATLVFTLCDGNATVREMTTDISELYEMPPDEVEPQVRTLIREFRTAGLIAGPRQKEPQKR